MSTTIFTCVRRALPKVLLGDVKALMQDTPDGDIYVIVPDQLTLETELSLFEGLGLSGSFRLNVVSPKRLCGIIFESCGFPAQAALDERGRAMLMGYLLRAHAKELSFYRDSAKQPGFEQQLLDAVKRFREAGLGAQELETLCSRVEDDALSAKIQDLSLLYSAYEAEMGVHIQDGEGEVQEAVARAQGAALLKNACALFYGFDITTQSVNRLIAGLSRICSQTRVYLPLPGQADAENSIYQPLREALDRLVKELKQQNLPFTIQALSQQSSKTAPGRNMELLYTLEKPDAPTEKDSVLLASLSNPMEECRFVASAIRKLMHDKGWKYSDIALIVDHPEAYEDALGEAFGACGIPYFSQLHRSSAMHPLCAFTLETLALLCRRAKSVYGVMETGFSPLTRDEQDALMSYCQRLRLRPAALLKPFTRGSGEMLSEAEPIRQKLMEPILLLRDQLRAAQDSQQQLTAIFEYLQRLNCFEICAKHRETLESMGEQVLAADDVRISNILLGTFDQMRELFGDRPLPVSTLYDLMSRALKASVVKILPQSPDAVCVSEPRRVGMGMRKAVFLLHAVSDESDGAEAVFDDAELARLSQLSGKYLSPDSMELARTRRMYVKDALCLATELVVVTYPAAGLEGSQNAPGALLGELQRACPGLKVRTNTEDAAFFRRVFLSAPAGALLYAAQEGQSLKDSADARVVTALKHLERTGKLSLLRRAQSYRVFSEALDVQLVRRLYSGKMSVSKLEKFQSCPFMHFVEEGLRPAQERPFEVDPIQRGLLLHECVERLMKLEHFSEMGEDAAEQSMQRIFDEELTGQIAPYARDSATALAGLQTLRRAAARAARLMFRQLEKGVFHPVAIEMHFGKNDLPVLRLKDGSALELNGQIDRVDMGTMNGRSYTFVVDYKSGQTSLNAGQIYAGLQLQLLVYLAVACRRFSSGSAGVYYFYVADKPVRNESRDAAVIEQERIKTLRLKGIAPRDAALLHEISDEPGRIIGVEFDKDGQPKESCAATQEEFELLTRHALNKCVETTEQILQGSTEISPMSASSRNACRYCRHKALCQYDGRSAGVIRRKPKPLKLRGLIAQLQQQQ